MVEYKLDALFDSLSDPTRRNILQRLTVKEMTVGEIAEAYNISFAAVSKHLKVLEAAYLITKERRGRQQFVRLSTKALYNVTDYVLHYEILLNTRLDSLGAYLVEASPKPKPSVTGKDDRSSEEEVVVVHVFDAPREDVWQAYTDPRRLKEWWAPSGTALVECKNDTRAGGQWRFVANGAGGKEYVLSGIFQAVKAPERLVYTEGFGEPDKPRSEALVTVTFEALPNGTTKMTRISRAVPAAHQLYAALFKAMQGG